MIGAVGRMRRLRSWQAIGVLFVLIAIVRVGMVLAFAPAFPFFDEWEGVVVGMAKPLRHGGFDPAYLVASHNGHPLLWTKLISLFFLWADDLQFDNVPVCLFNQLVYALGSATLAWSAATRLGPERGWFLFVAMLVIVLPFDWENITMGWGNSYALLSFFSVGLIVACACAQATSTGMLGIGTLGGAAALAMGSGLVAPLIGAGVLLWRMRLGELPAVRAAGMSAILIAWASVGFAAGLATQVTGQDAAWGVTQLAELALLLLCWLPTWVHLRRYLGGERSRLDLVILCVAVWAFVQIAAMILERPRYFRLWLPISRYMDIIPVGMFAVLASLCRLAVSRPGLPFGLPRVTARRVLGLAAIGVALVSPLAIYWQLRWAELHRDQARVMRAYLKTRDARVLADAPDSSLAYPSRERLKTLLDDPDTQSIIARALARAD
ncbi:MAG TPA: hypothetical protein VLB69_03155 [Rudaea sp.]|nr:hypothetical protein [Rudaea sp.]